MKSRHNDCFRGVNRPAVKQPASSVLSAADILYGKAVTHHKAGQLPQAEAICRRILQLSHDHQGALHLLGVIAYQSGEFAKALELIDKAIQINPRDPACYSNRGNILIALHQYQQALEGFQEAIRLAPKFADAYSNQGYALNELHRYQDALESCNKAIGLRPIFADAYNNRGNALKGLLQLQAAVESYDKAIHLKPDFADAYSNRGNALSELHQYKAALESCSKAIQLKPNYAEAYIHRGYALNELHQYQKALESFDKAISLHPDYKYLHGMQIYLKQVLCDWTDIETQCEQLEEQIAKGTDTSNPFITLSALSSPAAQKQAAEIHACDKYPSSAIASVIPRWPRHDRIRVGYYSADFCEHPVSYLMAELFERHDRSGFELLGFSFGRDQSDKMRERVSAAMDRFMDVRSRTDQEVVQLSRELEVDIAVDLMGFTKESRPGIFAARAAPVQVSYLGYPGTMGAHYMDYLLADHTLIPEASRQYYSETIAYLPDSFQANASHQPISDKPFSRANEGLPEQGFVYCCFNSNYKIGPRTFDSWMRILRRVEGSILWLLEGTAQACANLQKEAERRGVASTRLFFAKRLPLDEHLARQRLADLFLDTLPFNAGATASPALWAGLPVLTCMGEAFASRMGASLLRAIDLPELITTTEAAYENLAVEIALAPGRLQEIKEKLCRNRLTTPLFDLPSFARHLEAVYGAMHETYQMGLPPKQIDIGVSSKG